VADDTPDTEQPTTRDAAVLDRALRNFDSVVTAVQEERALALRDRRFCTIAGAQWEGDWAEQWQNSVMVEVNKTAQGVEKIIGDYRANRITVNFRGVGKGADEETADTLDGMFRADVYNSKGQQAFDNAFEEAVQGGIGAFRLVNEWDDELDPENDSQRLFFKAIVDADQSVFFDGNAKLYDKSDAMWCIVITAMSRSAFERAHPDKYSGASPWPDGLWKAYYDWYTPDVVKVGEYYEVQEREGVLRIFRHRLTGEERREWAADLDAEALQDMAAEGWREVRTRRAKRRIVQKWTLSGADVLKGPQRIAGECIPVVPVYGKRWFVDNMERSCGHVRRAVDPQRIYNAQISKLTETASLSPIERPIFHPEQMAGHSQSWADANINRAPYALINPMIDPTTGQNIPAGPIGKVEPPQLQPVLAALIQITANDIAELTSADDGADEAKANISAEAMDIAATRTDAKTAIYMDNFRQSMQRCGEIYASMARDVYVEEGREVETMSDDGQLGTAVLSEGVTDERGRYRIRNDLVRGKYKVISDVTEATATRRDKTVKTLLNVAQVSAATDPELSAAALNTALVNMDGEGMGDLQDWIRQRLVSQGIIKPTPEEAEQLAAAAEEEQQPDPQSAALIAVAEKESALAKKAVADTAQSVAKTALTEAQTEKTRAEAADGGVEKRINIIDRVRGMFGGGQKAA
jgi:hypothetical protein